MKIIRNSLVVLLGAILLTACTDENMPISQSIENFHTANVPLDNAYVDNTNGFSIQPPKGWTIDHSGINGAAVVFFDPKANNASDGTRLGAEIDLYSNRVPDGYTLDYYTRLDTIGFQGVLKSDYKVIDAQTINIDGREAQLIRFRFSIGSMPMEGVQLLTEGHGRFDVIVAMVLAPGWDQYQAQFYAALSTFKLQ